MRIDIEMGATAAGGAAPAPAMLNLEELLATRLLVQGNSGSGKSHLLRRLLEQSAAHVQQIVIDPEGDFVTLAERFGHIVVEGERSAADLACIAGRLRQHRVSAVLSLDTLEAEDQMRAAATFLGGLFEAERAFWFPALVVVDEAQLFAPAVSGEVAEEARKASLGAMTNLMCRGRKRGLAGIIATQRLAKLAKNVAAEATNFLMGRTFLDIDMARAADLLGLERRQAEMFRDLGRGQFVALGPALSRRPLAIHVGPVETAPRGGTPALTPLPEPSTAAEARDMILAPAPVELRGPVERRPPAPAPPSMTEILERIVRDRPPLAVVEPEADPLPQPDRDTAWRTIAYDILQETDAHFRPEPMLYQDFSLRCRIKRVGVAPPLADFRLLLAVARTGLDPDTAGTPEWGRAVAVARDIPDDLRAVFLIVAAAALAGAPCPSDATIAARCGQHAPGRARSRIRHLEKTNHVVVRTGLSGTRAIVLPDLGWETGWNDPAAEGAVPHARPERFAAE